MKYKNTDMVAMLGDTFSPYVPVNTLRDENLMRILVAAGPFSAGCLASRSRVLASWVELMVDVGV